jgi:hypothetical protein
MKFQGTIIKEQGVMFAVVIVKKHIINNPAEADRTIQGFQPIFPGMPVILMAQDARGLPCYYGRLDISRFMANVPLNAVPWKEYTI